MGVWGERWGIIYRGGRVIIAVRSVEINGLDLSLKENDIVWLSETELVFGWNGSGQVTGKEDGTRAVRSTWFERLRWVVLETT